MLRETIIEESKYGITKINIDIANVTDEFKKTLAPKIYIKIEPILNGILASTKLQTDDKLKWVEDIKNNIHIYYYFDNEIFFKLFHAIESNDLIKKLKTIKKDMEKQDKIPPNIFIQLKTEEQNLTKDLKELYLLRYYNLIMRYIDYFITLFE